MERQNEPLTQKKPWSELTEEERAVIRESWKHTLPEKFDVFCIGDIEYGLFAEAPNIPGCFYVSGNIECENVNVGEDSIVGGDVDCGHITVRGSSIIGGAVYCLKVNVSGDFIVRNCVDCYEINVGGLLDCYDVDSNFYPIYASDYICRCYEEGNI